MKLQHILIILFSCTAILWAQGESAPGSGSFAGSILPMMIVMIVVIYFLMIRPEQRKQKAKQEMLKEAKKGDKILTIGGIYGTINSVKDDAVNVKIADNTIIKITKTAISSVINKTAEKSNLPEKK